MNNMTSQKTYTDTNGIHYELFVGNNARAAFIVKDLDSGELVACIGGEESKIREKYRATIHKVAALELMAGAR